VEDQFDPHLEPSDHATHQSIAMPDFDSIAVVLLVERTVTQIDPLSYLVWTLREHASSRSNWIIKTA
jgi:hypothetical protein